MTQRNKDTNLNIFEKKVELWKSQVYVELSGNDLHRDLQVFALQRAASKSPVPPHSDSGLRRTDIT